MFNADIREVSLDFEVYDDKLSEKEEYFILSLNYSERPSDRCALVVRIVDNDCKIKHTSFYNLPFSPKIYTSIRAHIQL